MADQRPFRFRLPWLSAPVTPAPRPAAEQQPPRPTVQIQAPAQPTATIPIRRLPFPPAGIASAPPPATQTTGQGTERQPGSPPRAATESRVTSHPSSPTRARIPTSPSRETRAASVPPPLFRATPQSRAASVPPSPSRATTQTQAASQTQSPSRATPQSRDASVPPPSLTTYRPQPAALTVPQPESPSRLASRVPGKTSSQPSSPSKTATQVQPTISHSPSKKLQLATQETSQPPPTSTQSGTQQKVPLQKEIRADISKLVHKLGMGHMKPPIGGKPVSIITLAGENRGASMYVGPEPKGKDGSDHIHRGYKINPDEGIEAPTDREGSSKGRKSKDLLTKEDPATKAYINSNTQSVNNSILFESSLDERSSGVQMRLSHNDEEPSKYCTKPGPLETHKAEFTVTPAEKLTYEPTVKRRHLRGLFLESSDSDPDDPESLDDMAARYNCGQKSKDKDIGVL